MAAVDMPCEISWCKLWKSFGAGANLYRVLCDSSELGSSSSRRVWSPVRWVTVRFLGVEILMCFRSRERLECVRAGMRSRVLEFCTFVK